MFGINAAEAAVLVLTVAVVVAIGVALLRSSRRPLIASPPSRAGAVSMRQAKEPLQVRAVRPNRPLLLRELLVKIDTSGDRDAMT